jgi:hypothetical protein
LLGLAAQEAFLAGAAEFGVGEAFRGRQKRRLAKNPH